jgi:uncharacterized protein
MPHHKPRPDLRISDPFEFARRGDTLDGELPAASFVRLEKELRPAGLELPLHYRLEGRMQGGKAFIVLQLSGEVVLTCQRCLGDVACRLDSQSRLLLVPEGEDLPDDELTVYDEDYREEDDFDPIHASRNLDVLELVEDELLLSLPLSPMHEECSVPTGEWLEGPASPFAVLGKLQKS